MRQRAYFSAQAHGLRGETDSLEKMQARIGYDLG
jgi:hypothetical protein